ncbi:MFS transporter [Saccharopolyspora sp. 5N708]|uniref:MFS transporter n=1 Tax=Saccharopolyspora sp. 5N708 TaxID=3457424 RepID=UPI003FD5AD17
MDSAQSKFLVTGLGGNHGGRVRNDQITATTGSAGLPRNFRLLFAAVGGSDLGTQVTFIALPLTAVLVLHAGPAQVGAIGALSAVAFLVIGLPAGVWVDRLPRRAVMIIADLVRAVLFASIPVAWLLGVLTMPQLYAVALFSGVATVFSEVAAQSLLPAVVSRAQLVRANARLTGMRGVNQLVGRSVGGFLVSALTAPITIAVDAISYACSAVVLGRIRGVPPTATARRSSRVWADVREGLRHALGHRLLRPLALDGALTNFAMTLTLTVLPVVFVEELRLSEWVLGLFLAIGGCGALVGAAGARALGERFGHGRTLWMTGAASGCAGCFVPLVAVGSWLWLAAVAWLLITVKIGIGNVLAVSLRQSATPDHLMGRMNATFRFLLTGALAVASALAGVLGELAGTGAVLSISAATFAVGWLVVFLSPVRSLRELSEDPASAPTHDRVITPCGGTR